ncbi:NVEALA domain-containing protein [Parabacteroides faecis]|uniref:NVEALA domain-containing protein n=1 Tax=Parabacteroides faecis TaxID=1217282 RepID=UPI0021647E6F|nr:NVEALA domain-containing protein [Parabacteroides faecis]MCS2891206.1 NVEALA domain-containing protein [Parabacteroides faecis]UVQ45144.1 NVEALA domain-containing protein [Parabacteroides faecis]
MKNKLKLIGFMVCLIAGFYFWSNQKNELPALVLDNIEALAYGEHGDRVNCYGDGSVDCYGYWVEMRITGLSLE